MQRESKARIGFVGAGSIANGVHLPWYREISQAEIVALADPNEEALEQTAAKYNVPRESCYRDYRELVARDDIDAVEVCTPNHLHAEPTIAALEAGKHVLCQKPMATTMQDAEAMVAAAERSGAKLGVIYMQRFRPLAMHGARIVQSGLIGRPTMIRAHTGHAGGLGDMVAPGTWRRTFRDTLAGSFSLLAVHYADVFRWYMGAARRLASIGKTVVCPMEGDDNMAAVIEFENGAVGVLESCYNQVPGGSQIEVYGDQGTLILDAPDRTLRLHSRAEGQVSDEAAAYLSSLGGTWGQDLVVKQDQLEPLSPFVNYTEHWVDCLLNDRSPVTDGREGMASLELIIAAYEASANRCFVELSHQ